MPSNRQPTVVQPGPGKLASAQVPASALTFPVNDSELGSKGFSILTVTGTDTAPGGGVSSIVLPAGTFVGNTSSYPLELLFSVSDQDDKSILVGGNPVVVASISGATVGTMFSTGNVTLNLSATIPPGTQYKVYYQRFSTLSDLPIDALTFTRSAAKVATDVTYGGSGNWADGTSLPAASVEAALDGIVSGLAQSIAPTQGAKKIGFLGSSAWADSTTVTSSSVGLAIDEIVSSLAATTPPGAGKIGVSTSAFSGAITGIGGGGLTTSANQIQQALNEANNRLVSRRAFTAVCTDGVNSVGGDSNTTALDSILSSLKSGTYFLRRGSYTITDPLPEESAANLNYVDDASYEFVAESRPLRHSPNPLVSLAFSDNFTLPKGRTSFENLSLRYGGNEYAQLTLHGKTTLRNCETSAGTLYVEDNYNFGPFWLDVDGLSITHADDGKNAVGSMMFHNLNNGLNGHLRNVYISAIPDDSLVTEEKTTLHFSGNSSNALSSCLVIENSTFTGNWDGMAIGGSLLRMDNFRGNRVVFRGCVFYDLSSATTTISLHLTNSEAVFENCVFINDGTGKLLDASGDIRFRGCKFYTSTGSPVGQEIKANYQVAFEDCDIYVRSGSTAVLASARIHLQGSYVNGLRVTLTYNGGLNSNLFFHEANSLSLGRTLSNIEFNLNNNQAEGGATRRIIGFQALSLDGNDFTVPTIVNSLRITGVRGPGSGSSDSSLVYLGNAQVYGGTISSSSLTSAVEWGALFYLVGTESGVSGMHFNNFSTASLTGTYFKLAGNRCFVRECSGKIDASNLTSFAAFAQVTGASNYLDISHNAMDLSVPDVNKDFIRLTAAVEGINVNGNIVKCNGSTRLLRTTTTLNAGNIVGNTLIIDYNGPSLAADLNSSGTCVVTGNIFRNLQAQTISIGNPGTSIIGNNFITS